MRFWRTQECWEEVGILPLSCQSHALSRMLFCTTADLSHHEFSTEEDLTYNLKTNLFGVINTVNAFLPLLKENKEGKKQIFVTTSILGSIGGPVTSQSPAASACELLFLFPILRTKESSN